MKKLKICFSSLLLILAFYASTFAQNTLSSDYKKKIKEATPKMLPQTPVANKLRSDAEDDNLKGKIKSLVEEREGLTGIEKPIGRRMSLIADFDEKGNLLKNVYFEYRGRPTEVEVYGYIDNARVSVSKGITFGEPLRIAGPNAEPHKVTEKREPDPRYNAKYEYKYKDGKLSEIQIIYNTGLKGNHIIYNHGGSQREQLVYTEDGDLNSKYLYILDDKGNEIERVDFDVQKREVPEKGRFRFKYESFDEQGNWTKRIFSEIKVKGGKEIYNPIAIEYRTITYYQ